MNANTVNLAPRFLPARLPRTCVPVWATNANDLIQKADAVVRENSFIEFRLDYLAKPAVAFSKLKTFVEYHPEALLIATCRRAANGGKFRGSVASQVDILTKAANQGCHLLDIELESATRLKPADFARLRPPCLLLA